MSSLPPDTAVRTPVPIGPPRTAYSWVRWRGRLPFIVGLTIVLITFLAAVFAPVLTPYDPNSQDILNALAPPGTPGHLLGTDQFGRDVLTRQLYAARIDILIAVGATSFCLVTGSILGLVSGFFGGRVDAILMRIVDIVFAFPFIVLVLTIIAILGPGLRNMFISIWLVGWVPYARIVRGEVLVAKRQEYVLAARALGFNRRRVPGPRRAGPAGRVGQDDLGRAELPRYDLVAADDSGARDRLLRAGSQSHRRRARRPPPTGVTVTGDGV